MSTLIDNLSRVAAPEAFCAGLFVGAWCAWMICYLILRPSRIYLERRRGRWPAD